MSDDDDDHPAGFRHLRTSAADAPRPATTAPNSVFALGAQLAGSPPPDAAPAAPPATPAPPPTAMTNEFIPTSQKPAPKKRGRQKGAAPRAGYEQVLQEFAAHPEISVSAIAKNLDVHPTGVRKIVAALVESHQVRFIRKDGTVPLYGLATRRQQAIATKKAAAPAPAAITGAAVALDLVDTPRFRGGLFSDGTVQLEGKRGQLVLDGAEALQALQWLSRVDAALQAGAA